MINDLFKLILTTTTFLLVLIFNYLSNTDLIGTRSVGEISDRYPTNITPAGYAFSIWGLIYLLLISFTGYQWYAWKKKHASNLVASVGYFFTISNLANISWIVAWVNDRIALSLISICILLWSLFKLIQRLNLERWNAPFSIVFFVWWPLVIYLGWIVLATLLNVNIFLVSIGRDDLLWGPAIRGIIFIISGTLIYLYLLYTRNLRESALVGVWGFIAIAYKHYEANQSVTIVALIGSIVLVINVAYHAYKNRSSFASMFR